MLVHKEIRRYVIIKFSEYEKDFDLKNVLLEAINCPNHKVHSITGFRPCDIINNIDENIKTKVLDNIKKSLKIKELDDNNELKIGTHILINEKVHKKGKKLVLSKFTKKEKIFKIPGTILANYSGGLLAISIDIATYEFEKNEECIIEAKLCTLLTQTQWEKILRENEPKQEAKQKKSNKYRKYNKSLK